MLAPLREQTQILGDAARVAPERPVSLRTAASICIGTAQGSGIMSEARKKDLLGTASAPVSRLQRERAASKSRKQAAIQAAAMGAFERSGGEITLTVTPAEAANMRSAARYLHHVADYLGDMENIGTMMPRQVRLADIPEDVTPNKKVIVARSERQIYMANLLRTIDFLLGCPGDNIEICDALWRMYEGLLFVEETGRRFPAFEPDGARATGSPDSLMHVTRKAAVGAAVTAYMFSGLTEQQALQRAMKSVERVTPSHFGIGDDKEITSTTVGNWRDTLNKGRTTSEEGLRRYGEWIKQVTALRKQDPERLIPWADRLLFAVIRRV